MNFAITKVELNVVRAFCFTEEKREFCHVSISVRYLMEGCGL